jgi:hypothetical protein
MKEKKKYNPNTREEKDYFPSIFCTQLFFFAVKIIVKFIRKEI